MIAPAHAAAVSNLTPAEAYCIEHGYLALTGQFSDSIKVIRHAMIQFTARSSRSRDSSGPVITFSSCSQLAASRPIRPVSGKNAVMIALMNASALTGNYTPVTSIFEAMPGSDLIDFDRSVLTYGTYRAWNGYLFHDTGRHDGLPPVLLFLDSRRLGGVRISI